jgi:hypothetical protein
MKCIACGRESMNSAREDQPFVDLPDVTLVGVWVHRCSACGEFEVEIPRPAALGRTIALALVEKAGPFEAVEFRFLRKHLDLSAEDPARYLAVDKATVSRWENSRSPVPVAVDRVVRGLVRDLEPVPGWFRAAVPHLAGLNESGPMRLRVRNEEGGWAVAA